MEVQQDYRDLLELFNAHEVQYVIVGAYALAFHGAPRFTSDIDLLVRPVAENARRILTAPSDFGFGSVGLTVADFVHPNRVVQLGVPPVRVDLVMSISAVSWWVADAGKVPGIYSDVPVHFLGREQYIANKRAVGRHMDLADLEALGESPE
jgi:hypothetical protein